MITITNTTEERTITAPETGQSLAPGKAMEVSEAELDAMLAQPYIAGQVTRGNLVVSRTEPDPDGGITRSALAKMSRAELLDVILPHYGEDVTEADFEGVRVDDKDGQDGLRTIAARLVFTDL